MRPYVNEVSSASFSLRRGQAPALRSLDLELTERCNNDCIHCCINRSEHDEEARGRELSTSEVIRILDQAVSLGALDVRFTGGEPLLRQDFPEIYLHARRSGLRVILFTNARLVTSELAGLLARIPPLLPVEVTAYGMQQESYEAVARAPRSHAEFCRGVGLLKTHGIAFVVKGTSLPPGRGELGSFRRWSVSVGAMTSPPSLVVWLDLRHRRDSEAKNRQILALRPTPGEGLQFLSRAGSDDLREKQEFCSRFVGARGRRLFSCGAGAGVSVDAYGRLQPCLGLRAPVLTYDLRRGSLAEALHELLPKLRAMEATNPAYLERCARCFIRGLCEQCPAKSWVEHGTLDTPVEYFCDIAHEEAQALGMLHPGEKAWRVADGSARVARLVGGDL